MSYDYFVSHMGFSAKGDLVFGHCMVSLPKRITLGKNFDAFYTRLCQVVNEAYPGTTEITVLSILPLPKEDA